MRQDGDENAMHLEVEELGQRCTKEDVYVQIERTETMMASARFGEWYVEKGISDLDETDVDWMCSMAKENQGISWPRDGVHKSDADHWAVMINDAHSAITTSREMNLGKEGEIRKGTDKLGLMLEYHMWCAAHS